MARLRGIREGLMTDGVTEASNLQGGQFGCSRLASILAQCKEVPAAEMVCRIDEALSAHG